MNIKGKDFTLEELESIIELAGEMVVANETLNTQLIALMAKLSNEENKVRRLVGELYYLQQHNNKYTA
jgi:hypothetical protein|tara:strand:+ start:864 stop:1067 length:204 start_codon:yes stop_codon:yes gene_type:complete